MSQWLLVRLARVLHETRQELLIGDGSLFDPGVERALDKAAERIGLTLHQYNTNIDAAAFALNAGHSNPPRSLQSS